MNVGAFLLFVVGVVVAALAGFFVGSAYALAHLATITDPQAILVTGFIAAALALGTAIIAIWGVYSQRVLARRQATIEHIARLEADASAQEDIRTFITLTADGSNLAKWADAEYKGHDNTQAIIAVLNFYEIISIGIQRGIFEYELVKGWNETSIQRYWSKAHPFVVALRDRVGAQTLWQEFEKLNAWVSGTKRPMWSLWWTGFG
jgi:Domain of unknown function (DUF4760)